MGRKTTTDYTTDEIKDLFLFMERVFWVRGRSLRPYNKTFKKVGITKNQIYPLKHGAVRGQRAVDRICALAKLAKKLGPDRGAFSDDEIKKADGQFESMVADLVKKGRKRRAEREKGYKERERTYQREYRRDYRKGILRRKR